MRIELARAAAVALAAGPGVVRAAFERSCYVQTPGGGWACLGLPGPAWTCLGVRATGRGPLNAWVVAFVAPPLGRTIEVSLASVPVWQPEPVAGVWSEHGAIRLSQAARGCAPAEALAGLLTGESMPLIEPARPAVEALAQGLRGERAAPDAQSLIGLDPGLTPSGDDYFGGALVALQRCGRSDRAQQLVRWLQLQLAGGKNEISAARLAAAPAQVDQDATRRRH